MIKISSENNNINVNVASAGNKSNVNLSYPQSYYDGLSKQWAISENIVNSEDYSSKHYAEESKKQANLAIEQATIATNKANEVIDSGNEALSKISAQETTSKNAVKAEGDTQVASVLSEGKEQVLKIQAEGNSQFANIQTEGQAQVDSVKNQGAVSASSVNSAGELQVKAVKSEGINQVNLAKAEVVKATEQANLAKQYASSVDKEGINISKMYTTGLVSEDTQGYNQLVEMKHSTFDKSKFTIVGNPTITDDGIASGFSGSNYVTTTSIDLSTANNWEIISPSFKIDDVSASLNSILCNNTNTIGNDGINEFVRQSGKISWSVQSKLGTFLFKRDANTNLQNGITYQTKLVFTGTKYELYLSTNKSEFILVDSYTDSTKANLNIVFSLGKAIAQFFTGSIDLNAFSITVDGKEVFSGNKTGIDTIKANNYEVVGSPVITDDGIVSGFSGSDYLKTASFSFSNYWKFNCKFNIKNIPDTLFPFLQLSSFNRILLQNSGNIRIFADENNNTGHFVDLFGINTIQTNTNYDLEISYNNNLYYGKLTNLDNNSIVTSTVTSMYYFPTDSSNWSIGSDCSRYIDGSLDLNSFKIYVDNNLVYQPCLKIPYTQSKTGSKIVDVAYGDRVQDMYEQTGVAPYYTIDETNQNFTLPMGEIYGMIESVRSNKLDIPSRYVVEISDKSLMPSWYVVYSDGWCEQGGGSTNGSVIFVKPFVDTNYTFNYRFNTTDDSGISLKSFMTKKTTKSCILINSNYAGDWHAQGYIS